MATDPQVNLRGDATSLISAIDQAVTAFVNFEKVTAKVVKDQSTLNRSGDVLVRTLTQIDAAGNRVTTTWRNLGDEITQTSTVVRAQSDNLKVLASQAALAAEATALLARADALAAASGIKQDTQLVATAEALRIEAAAAFEAAAAQEALAVAQKNAGAAAAARIKGTRLNTEAEALATKAIEASKAARASAVPVINAEVAALRARAVALRASIAGVAARAPEVEKAKGQRVKDEDTTQGKLQALDRQREAARIAAIKREGNIRIADEKRVAAEFIAQTAGRDAAIQKQTIQRIADEKRVAAEFTKQTAQQIADQQKVIDTRIAAELKAGNLNRASLKAQTIQRIADEQRVAAEFRRLTIQKITDEERIIATRISGELEARTLNLAGLKKQTAQRIADEKRVAAEFIRLENLRRANTIQTRTPVVAQRLATGTAGKQEINNFLQAEVAVRKFAATSVGAFKQVEVAIAQARAGTLKFTGNLTQAELAALELAAAEKQVAIGADQANVATKGLGSSIKGLANLIGISLLIGGAFRLVTAITAAADQAATLSIKIAQVNTIAGTSTRTTEEWADSLRALSSAFGIDTLSQADGLYQIISRQIKNSSDQAIKGAEALRFLTAANQLAVTGATDAATATDLLTSAINSFRIPSEQAELVAAKLFKAVELGALRVEDLSGILGRVAVPANQLGISLEEVAGSIDAITRQGFKADEAITAIRNVILKLLKPTAAGEEALTKLGVATGRALIDARGFIPALTSFINELGNTVEGTAEGFGRIRAIVGALALSGKGAQDAEEAIKALREQTTEAFGEKTQLVIQSTGQQLAIMGATARNLFEKELGTPAIEAIVRFIKEMGGIDSIVTKTISVLNALGRTIGRVLAGAALAGAALGLTNLALAFKAARVAGLSFGAALGKIPILAIATAAVIAGEALSALILSISEEELKAVEDANLAVLQRREDAAKKTRAILSKQTAFVVDSIEETTKKQLGAIALQRRAATDLISEVGTQSKELERSLTVATSSFNAGLTARIANTKKAVQAATKDAKAATDDIEKTFQALNKKRLGIDLIGAGAGQSARVLDAAIEQAQAKTQAAAEEGSLAAFKLQNDLLKELTEKRIAASIKVSNAEVQNEVELADLRAKLTRVSGRGAREVLEQRIAAIQREQKLVKNGSEAQLQAAKKLSDLQESLGEANTGEDFDKIFKEIAKVRREQEAIEKSAAREQQIRLAGLQAFAEERQRLETIRSLNEERAKEEGLRQRRLEIAQFLFRTISKEADAFNQKQVLATKERDKLVEQVGEQQKRLARIRSLQTLIGGGAEAEGIQRERALNLEAATRAELTKRAEDDRVANLKLQQKDLKEALSAAEGIRIGGSSALTEFAGNLQNFENALQGFQTSGVGETNAGIAQSRQQQQIFGAPQTSIPGAPGALATRGLTEPLDKFLQRQIKAQNAVVVSVQENVTRLRELTEQLQTGVQDPSLLQEFNIRFNELKKVLLAGGGNFGQVDARSAPDVVELEAAFGRLLANQNDTTRLGDIQGVTKEDQARQAQIAALQLQNKLIDIAIAAKAGETQEVENAATKTLDFAENIKKASAAIIKRQGIFDAPANIGTVPGEVTPPPVVGLTREIDATIAKGSKKTGTEAAKNFAKAFKEEVPGIAVEQAKATVEAEERERTRRAAGAARSVAAVRIAAENAERLKAAPTLEARLAGIRAQAETKTPVNVTPQREELPKTLPRREIDTTIRLGRGAPSIQLQQNAIAEQFKQENERQVAFQKARREAEKQEKALARQGLRPGQRLAGPRPGTLKDGPKSGTFKDGPRPETSQQGGEGPTQQKQLTVSEQIAANTKVLADAAQSPFGLGIKSPTQSGTPESRVSPELLKQIGRGQADAERELKEVLERRVADAKAQELIDEEIRTLQFRRARISFEDVEERQKALDIIKQQREISNQLSPSKPIQPFRDDRNSRDALVRALSQTKLERPAGEQRTRSTIQTTQVNPFGAFSARGSLPGVQQALNVGPVTITIEESTDPKVTAREVVAEINRGIRTGTVQLRPNSGPRR